MTRGLAHLHSRTPLIVHGSLRPENVLIKDNLEAALCDFGASRVLSLGKANEYTPIKDWLPQHLAYLGKDILSGRLSPTAPGDVYALGGLILLTMSGEPPFKFWRHGETAVMFEAVSSDQTPSPSDHPCFPEADPLWSLLRECWHVDHKNRPTSDTVLQKLERTLEERLVHSICLTDV